MEWKILLGVLILNIFQTLHIMIIKSAVCEFVESLYRDWWLTFNAAAVDSSNTLKAKLTFCLSNVESHQAIEVNLRANLATEC